MVDRTRFLAKIDELDQFLEELRQITPTSREEYGEIEKKRACERLLQISIETVMTICQLLVAGKRLGLPSEPDDLFEKLAAEGLISNDLSGTLKTMKGFRNILVHEYGRIDDDLVYQFLATRVDDFHRFRREIVAALDSL